jgi:hypothetical protein
MPQHSKNPVGRNRGGDVRESVPTHNPTKSENLAVGGFEDFGEGIDSLLGANSRPLMLRKSVGRRKLVVLGVTAIRAKKITRR